MDARLLRSRNFIVGGGDDDGEASFGSSESNVFPPEEIMTMPDLQAWTDVAIGRNHICARSGDGEIWCAR